MDIKWYWINLSNILLYSICKILCCTIIIKVITTTIIVNIITRWYCETTCTNKFRNCTYFDNSCYYTSRCRCDKIYWYNGCYYMFMFIWITINNYPNCTTNEILNINTITIKYSNDTKLPTMAYCRYIQNEF